MMVFGLSNYFLDTSSLYWLLVLIPFLLLYIIKPKPKKIIIPSLMFFIKDKDKSNLNSFLQRFIQDFLFYIQFLILFLLAITFAKPFINASTITYADNLVIVMDGSASMNAVEDGKSRFERAQEEALKHVEGKNTVILAADKPELVLENGNSGDAKVAINTLSAKDTSTNLYDSIVLSEQFAHGDNSLVFVVSDFANEKIEQEFLRAKSYLESRGIKVFFKDISLNKARNVGFIDLLIKETETTAWVKNFNNNPQTIRIRYGDKVQDLNLEANDVKSITVPNLHGKSVMEIDTDDDFKNDNKAYISTSEEASIDIMYLANNDNKYFISALEIMDKIKIEKDAPPIVNFNDPHIIVIGDVDKKVLLPGYITKIKQLCHDYGVSVIVLAQDDILSLGLGDMLPLEFIDPNPTTKKADSVVPTSVDSYLTPSEIQFGQIRKMYQIKDKDNIQVIAKTQTDKYPVITINQYGRGKVMFYGLFEDYSDFKSDIFYPIFWKRALDTLIGGKNTGELNKKTGYILFLPKEETIQTPKGKKTVNSVQMDYSGFYELKSYTVGANLINEEEQRLNRGKESVDDSKLKKEFDRISNETKKHEIIDWLIYIIFGLLIFELFYLKIRGDA